MTNRTRISFEELEERAASAPPDLLDGLVEGLSKTARGQPGSGASVAALSDRLAGLDASLRFQAEILSASPAESDRAFALAILGTCDHEIPDLRTR